MSKYPIQKHHFIIFAFFFIAGIFWGKYYYYGDNQKVSILRTTPLRILVEEKSLPTDVIENFSLEANTPIEIDTYSTLHELDGALEKHSYDIIWYKSLFANDLLNKNHLQKMATKELKFIKNISVDFKNPPYDKKNEYVIPILWGVNKATLWTENISIYRSARNIAKAYEFINYIFDPDITKAIVKTRNIATTSNSLEKTDIPANLKPSALRRIPIHTLKYETN